VGDPAVAIVVVSSPFEAGGDRAKPALAQAAEKLRAAGLKVVAASDVVWDVADASRITRAWSGSQIDLLVIVHASWVEDSLQLQLQREAQAPVMLWSLPYPETYALASVKHFASVAWRTHLPYRWGEGNVDEPEFAAQVADFARTAAVARRFRHARVALFTPRTAWRMFGPMDMSYDEWDLGSSLGITLLHLDLEELIAEADKQEDNAAQAELARHAPAYGKIQAAGERMLYSSKMYLACKAMIEKYGLDAAAAACYPTHFGLVNLASSWLSGEGFHFDPEGDVGSAVLANAMLAIRPTPVALAEPAHLQRKADSLLLRHEGSAPAALAAAPSETYVIDLGEQKGTLIEFPLRKAETVTAVGMAGRDGKYDLYMGKLRSLGIPASEWEALGRGFLANVTAKGGGEKFLAQMFETGMDHHMLLQEGDQTAQLADLADLWGVGVVRIAE
jgi:L-fucose isomerase-like protein